jgi:hypothetical protein
VIPIGRGDKQVVPAFKLSDRVSSMLAVSGTVETKHMPKARNNFNAPTTRLAKKPLVGEFYILHGVNRVC